MISRINRIILPTIHFKRMRTVTSNRIYCITTRPFEFDFLYFFGIKAIPIRESFIRNQLRSTFIQTHRIRKRAIHINKPSPDIHARTKRQTKHNVSFSKVCAIISRNIDKDIFYAVILGRRYKVFVLSTAVLSPDIELSTICRIDRTIHQSAINFHRRIACITLWIKMFKTMFAFTTEIKISISLEF